MLLLAAVGGSLALCWIGAVSQLVGLLETEANPSIHSAAGAGRKLSLF